ncbi:MAG TPA: VIT domain-containing protein, partial [Anaeromyxobacter sp.]
MTLSLAFAFLLSAASPAALAAPQVPGNPVRIDAVDVMFSIDHHFATTKVRETLTNPSDQAVEFVASLGVPDLAFVTRFALETAGHTFESRIEDATAARAAYNETAAASSAAAIVEGRGTHTFLVSLNLPPTSTVTVHFSYEQLVTRAGDRFEYRFP